MNLSRAIVVACLWLAIVPVRARGQENDASFNATVRRPAYASGDGPRLLFDEHHRNLHTASGRYAAFAAVAKLDGFRVEPSRMTFSEASPPRGVILIVANARGAKRDSAPAFSPPEVRSLRSWVKSGGSLLLIADHAPFGSASKNLAAAFDVEMIDGNVEDIAHQASGLPGPSFLEFTRANGLLARDHPITSGRSPAEELTRVVTFGGLALRGGPEAAVLLKLGPKAKNILDPDDARSAAQPVGGLAQAVALRIGNGRVVVVGEAGLFGAQRIDGEAARKAGLPGALMFGMNYPGTDDEQFLLNVLHWLSHLL